MKNIYKLKFKDRWGKTILKDDIMAKSQAEARRKFLRDRIKIK